MTMDSLCSPIRFLKGSTVPFLLYVSFDGMVMIIICACRVLSLYPSMRIYKSLHNVLWSWTRYFFFLTHTNTYTLSLSLSVLSMYFPAYFFCIFSVRDMLSLCNDTMRYSAYSIGVPSIRFLLLVSTYVIVKLFIVLALLFVFLVERAFALVLLAFAVDVLRCLSDHFELPILFYFYVVNSEIRALLCRSGRERGERRRRRTRRSRRRKRKDKFVCEGP